METPLPLFVETPSALGQTLDRTFPAPARVIDWIFAGLGLFSALMVTAIPTTMLLIEVMGPQFMTPEVYVALGLMALWNMLIFGPAMWCTVLWWMRAIRWDRPDRTFLLRCYWRVQWMTLLSAPVLALFCCIGSLFAAN